MTSTAQRPRPPEPLTPLTFLGLGAMGSELARTAADDHPVTVWNRNPVRANEFAAGIDSEPADSVTAAVAASPVVIICLLDHASVHQVLDPVSDRLAGKALINLTTTTPEQAVELAAWSADIGADYLDGGIMAVPEMIGGPASSILYSGAGSVFEEHRPLLDKWGQASYLGADPGLASLYDLALLSGMYVAFAGLFHGAAMVASAGISAGDFAARAVPFLTAVIPGFAAFADTVDNKAYTAPGQQSLEFSDLGDLVAASAEAGVSTDVVQAVQNLIRRQIDAGHGADGFARIYESIVPESATTKRISA